MAEGTVLLRDRQKLGVDARRGRVAEQDAACMPPLVVDLDGTLLRSDLTLETVLTFVRNEPLQLFKAVGWLRRGMPALKAGLADAAQVDVTLLPYDSEVIALIIAERCKGRRIVLATGSHHALAERIADHLQLFDQVLGTRGDCNLTAQRKRDALIDLYGEQGFDYAGNSADDLPVWAAARRVLVVNPELGVEGRALAQGRVEQVIRSNPSSVSGWLKALRLHQWVKNLLIFVPLMAAHQLANPAMLRQGMLAFLLFGLCASSVYLLNDLLDLGEDRRHHAKRKRPFASGRLSIKSGVIAAPVLLAASLLGSLWLLSWQFAGVLAAYYTITLAYSLALKRLMAVDVIALALLYTTRVIAGAAACGLVLTFWMLAFSMFMFLSLALVKRYAELKVALGNGCTDKAPGRGYYPDDLGMISTLGTSSGYLAVMVLALYIHDQVVSVLYRQPQVIWLACPLLLFWVTRVWLLTHRGQMHDDPVVFALRDRVSLFIGALFCSIFWVAA